MSKSSRKLLPPGARTLTLDISSAVGYCFAVGTTAVKWGKYVSDKGDLSERLFRFSQWLSKTINSLPAPPEVVIIEQPFLGRNPHTYAVLNKYVGVAQREIFRILSIEPIFISPSEVKRTLGLPGKRSHPQHKRNMIAFVNRKFGTDFQYVAGKKTKSKHSDDDIADAFGILYAYLIKAGLLDTDV